MKRRLSSLQCLRNRDSLLLHCLNQCLSHTRSQLHNLIHSVCLNQKTRKRWASSQINAFLQILNLDRQNVSCHASSIVAENGYKFNYDQYPCKCLWPRPGYSVARGLVPRSRPRINLGAAVLPLTMSGWSIKDDWAPGNMSLRGTASRRNLWGGFHLIIGTQAKQS